VYSERFSLPFIAQLLIAAAERKRPGLGPWTPAVESELQQTFRAELQLLKPRFLELFDDPKHWAHVERTMIDVCFPRYAAEAKRFSELEQRDFGLWRGGDLVARFGYLLAGVAMGFVALRILRMPAAVDATLFLVAIGAPFWPDAQVGFHKRRYAKRIRHIDGDMRQVEEQQRLYPPLMSDAEATHEPEAPKERVGQKG
jgi:hypothetical protein